LGTKESVRPDVRSEVMCEGDIYLLCSDGLSGEVTDEEMLAAVFEAGDALDEASELLVAMANEAGGRDNISALVVRITDPESLPHDARRGLVVVQQPDVAIEVDEPDEVSQAEIAPEVAPEQAQAEEAREEEVREEVFEELDEEGDFEGEPQEVDVELDEEAWTPDSSVPPWSEPPEEGLSEPPEE